jgi:hypothetical protein
MALAHPVLTCCVRCLLSEDNSPTPLDARQPSEDPPLFPPGLADDANDDPLSAAELAVQKEQEAQQQQQLSEEDMPRRYKTKRSVCNQRHCSVSLTVPHRCINFQKYGKCTYGIRYPPCSQMSAAAHSADVQLPVCARCARATTIRRQRWHQCVAGS